MAADEIAGENPAKPDLPLGKVLALLGVQATLMTAAGMGLWHWSERPLADFVSVSLDELVLGFVFAAALILMAATLFHGFPKVSDQLVRLQSDTYRFLGRDLGWPAIVLISLCAGISEEAFLRAGLQTLLGDQIGPIPAIAVSAAVFAALHLAKPIITALLLVIGLMFGVAYWLTDSLLAVIIAHVLYDVWALRYLNREMHRLGLFDTPEAIPAPLANASDPG